MKELEAKQAEHVRAVSISDDFGRWDIPAFWKWLRVADIGAVALGRQRSPKDHSGPQMRPYVRAANITWDGWSLDDVKKMNFDDKEFAHFHLRHGDVLINEGSGSAKEVGKPAVWRDEIRDCCFQNTLLRVRPNSTSPEYLYLYFLFCARTGRFVSSTQGVNIFHIGKTGLAKFPLPVPPLSEQRRIVAKIDNLTNKSKRAREQLDHVPRLVEKYKQAVLAAAFRGDLSGAWREANDVHESWRETTVGALVSDIVAGKNLRCEERPPRNGERGTLKVSAVTWGKFDASQTKTLPTSFVPPAHTRVQVGDFLISRANTVELVGAVVVVDETPTNLYLSDKILRLELDDADKPWLLWYLRSPAGRDKIEEGSSGNQLSMRNLSQNKLRAISLPWPDRKERAEVVRRIEHAFTWIDRLAAEAGSAHKLIDRLNQAILAKAFRGELVPQDPTDEPASALLDRIRAQRTTRQLAPKRKARKASN